MPGGGKGRDLRAQALCQVVPGAGGDGRDVVDGFVAIQLGALTAGLGQGVDDMGRETLQAQLKTWNSPTGPAPITTASVCAGNALAVAGAVINGPGGWALSAPDP
jgi:hypothetical protein